jgi:hypothetical protein
MQYSVHSSYTQTTSHHITYLFSTSYHCRCREEEDQYYSDYIPVYTTAVESAAIFTISTVPLDTSVDIQYSEYTDSDSALNSCEKGKSKSNNKSKGKNRVKGKSRRSGEPSSVSTPVAEMVPAEDADPAVDDGPH